jgi:ABC-type multidrug transport system ATPase subunit
VLRVSKAAISVSGLRKAYGEHEAVRGIEFEVAAGEVFGFLGPNGAGKTTTVEILEGYVAVLAVWALLGARVAARRFRWEPISARE